MLIEQRVTNEGPSAGVSWLLLLFMGFFGAHRFYLGRVVSGLLMLLTLGGFGIWWFIDLFLVSGMIRQRRDEVRQRLTMAILASGEGANA
jgi:TM2 domain-containing membrane protein YozV